jgi:hypothetical protein
MSDVMIGARVARNGATPDARVARSSNRGAFVASNWPRPSDNAGRGIETGPLDVMAAVR